MNRLGDIRFYDRSLNPVSILPRYISADWQLYHRKYGTAELHFAKTRETVELFTSHKYLFVEQGTCQGFVTGVQIGKDCTVFVRTPEWLLTKFTLADFVPEAKTASAAACELVRAALPEEVSLTLFGQDADETDCSAFAADGAQTAYDALLFCLTNEATGFSLRFTPKEGNFTFRVYRGQERPSAVLSEELKTAYDITYTADLQQEASGAVYYQEVTNGGRWNPVTNEPYLRIDAANYGTYYTAICDCEDTNLGISVKDGDVILCRDKSGQFIVTEKAEPFLVEIPPAETGMFAWRALLSAETEEEAERELKDLRQQTNVDCKTKNIPFGTAFDLGDTVTAVFAAEAFCLREKRIITGVHIWDDTTGCGCLPETGDAAAL